MTLPPQRAYLPVPSLEETEWFECRARPVGYVREQRLPYYRQERTWEHRPMSSQWMYPPAQGGYMRVNPTMDYNRTNGGYRAYPQKAQYMGSVRPGLMQQPLYPPMSRPLQPQRPQEVSVPHGRPVVAAPKEPEKLYAPVPADDNANKPALLAPVKGKKPSQLSLKSPSTQSSVQHLISDLPFLKDSTQPPTDASKPDFDSVLATAAHPPVNCPDQLSTLHSESLTSSSPHESSEVFSCPVPNCTKTYQRKCRVLEHLRRGHYREGAPLFKCSDEKCARTFDTLESFKCHQRNEAHSKNYIILFNTEKKSSRPAEPTSRRQRTEDGSDTVKYQCTSCEKSYSNKYRRDAHAAVCTGNGNKAFACAHPGCGKAYATKDSLTRHLRVFPHGGEAGEGADEESAGKSGSTAEKSKEEGAGFRDRVQELVDLFDEI